MQSARRLAGLASLSIAAVLSLSLAAPALAAGGGGDYATPPIDRSNFASLQRGAATFVNYCLGCHSAEYVRYGRLVEDLGISEDILRANLIHTGGRLSDGMQTAMNDADAQAWFNDALPPDLSLSAKLRGADWLYAYMHGFYVDEARPSGWNNTVFANVAMPHVLYDLQGARRLDESGDLVAVGAAGRLSAVEYDVMVVDLVNFMQYMADPDQPLRYRAGYITLSVLFALLIAFYFLYREFWRDIH